MMALTAASISRRCQPTTSSQSPPPLLIVANSRRSLRLQPFHLMINRRLRAVNAKDRRRLFQCRNAAVVADVTDESNPKKEEDQQLPIVRDIPGSYGLPWIGAWSDKSKFFQDQDEFFYGLMKQHDTTVVRCNMPPGPPFFPDGKTIMMLDQRSIRAVFDVDLVHKKDVFTGTYVPSLGFTNGYRVLSYLDPSEENHKRLKSFCFAMLRSASPNIFPEFHSTFIDGFAGKLESAALPAAGTDAISQFTFNFLSRAFLNGTDPAATSLSTNGPTNIQLWTLPQVIPQASLGLPSPIEALLHTFPVPGFLLSVQLHRLLDFFRTYGTKLLDMAQSDFGIPREEACMNVLFFLCFNTWGGLQILFPSILHNISAAGAALQDDIAAEVRREADPSGGQLSMAALEKMELLKSTVYEVLRIEPPVPFQFGRAKRDMVISSHKEGFKVKEGEMLASYQKIAMRDPVVFGDTANDFNPRRFMGADGSRLLDSLTWSNGAETSSPTTGNKQCAGKDFVVLVARIFVAELFLRYDFFEVDPAVKSPTFTTLVRRKSTAAVS